MKTFSILILLTVLGCAPTYEVRPSSLAGQAARVSNASSIFVGLPHDGRFEGQSYSGSGEETAQAIVAAVSTHVQRVESARDILNFRENLDVARAREFQYLIYSKILRWEDHVTESSEIPDQISIRLDLVNVLTGKIVDSTTVSSKSRWMTFGGDHPQELLPEPMRAYADSIFAP